jgi:hypothetical protein
MTLQNDGCLLTGKQPSRPWPEWGDDRGPARRGGPFQGAGNVLLPLWYVQLADFIFLLGICLTEFPLRFALTANSIHNGIVYRQLLVAEKSQPITPT